MPNKSQLPCERARGPLATNVQVGPALQRRAGAGAVLEPNGEPHSHGVVLWPYQAAPALSASDMWVHGYVAASVSETTVGAACWLCLAPSPRSFYPVRRHSLKERVLGRVLSDAPVDSSAATCHYASAKSRVVRGAVDRREEDSRGALV